MEAAVGMRRGRLARAFLGDATLAPPLTRKSATRALQLRIAAGAVDYRVGTSGTTGEIKWYP